MDKKLMKYIHFEELVLSVLRQMSISSGKRLLLSQREKQKYLEEHGLATSYPSKSLLSCDAIAPDGLEDISDPLVIEIKYNVGNTSFPQLTNTNFFRTLYIIHSSLTEEKIGRKDPRVIIWDKNKISEWKHHYPIDYYTFFSDELENDTQIDFESKIRINQKLLRNDILERRISIALGAGASLDFGSLNWNALIKSFYLEIQKSGTINSIEDVQKKIGGSSIIDGQFAVENLKDFVSSLYSGIYGNFAGPISKYPYSTIMNMENLVKKLVKNPPNTFNRFNIITYNYDNYLEQALEYWGIDHTSIYNSEIRTNAALHIYHPHGFLPFKCHPNKYNEYRKGIVFSECEYHALYNNPYSWAMVLQEHLYRENVFLFIGCSLSDPNLRRILELTKAPGKTHFAFMLSDNLSKVDQFIVHKHFMRLGVECIWFDNEIALKAALRCL